jgi:hypothetical protein
VLHVDVHTLAETPRFGPENWGQLLDRIEQGEGSGRRVVTAVRFDGVAMPTFRDPSALKRSLRTLGPIEIETTTVDDLLRESARAANESVAPLQRAITRIGDSLRRSAHIAPRDLQELIASVQMLTEVTIMLAASCSAAAKPRCDLDRVVPYLRQALDGLLDAQTANDPAAAAGVLERDLTAALDQWSSTLCEAWSF